MDAAGVAPQLYICRVEIASTDSPEYFNVYDNQNYSGWAEFMVADKRVKEIIWKLNNYRQLMVIN